MTQTWQHISSRVAAIFKSGRRCSFGLIRHRVISPRRWMEMEMEMQTTSRVSAMRRIHRLGRLQNRRSRAAIQAPVTGACTLGEAISIKRARVGISRSCNSWRHANTRRNDVDHGLDRSSFRIRSRSRNSMSIYMHAHAFFMIRYR